MSEVATDEAGTGAVSGRLKVSITATSEMPAELVTRIETAVRRAVLLELADVDLGPGYRITPIENGEDDAAARSRNIILGLIFDWLGQP